MGRMGVRRRNVGNKGGGWKGVESGGGGGS